MAQLVALMSGVVLGGVAEVVGTNLARGKIFTASIGSVDSLYPSVYIYIYLFVYSYTAKFVFDLLDVRKTRFSHDEAHMSKIIQCNYSNLAGKLLVPIYTIFFYFT